MEFMDCREIYSNLNHEDAFGILKFLFDRAVLEACTWKMAHIGEQYLQTGLFADPTGVIEKQPEFGDDRLDFTEAKLHLCSRWANSVRVLRKIGVKEPELAFLISDLAESGTWLLTKAVFLHGETAVANIINTLSEEGGMEMLHLSEIITSDDPAEAASAYGVDWEFQYENEMLLRRERRKAYASAADLAHVIKLNRTPAEAWSAWHDKIQAQIINTIRRKKIDMDMLAFEMGTDRSSLLDGLLHCAEPEGFYLRAEKLVEEWPESLEEKTI